MYRAVSSFQYGPDSMYIVVYRGGSGLNVDLEETRSLELPPMKERQHVTGAYPRVCCETSLSFQFNCMKIFFYFFCMQRLLRTDITHLHLWPSLSTLRLCRGKIPSSPERDKNYQI